MIKNVTNAVIYYYTKERKPTGDIFDQLKKEFMTSIEDDGVL
jgi:hypothetical protein